MKIFFITFIILILTSSVNAKCNFNCSKDKPTRDGYQNNISPYKHAFELVSYPHPVRYGKKSERFEVRDGDCGGSDCKAPRYRSEIAIHKNKTKARIGKDIWYGWSFYNKNIPSFDKTINLGIVVGQWKMGGDNHPMLFIKQFGDLWVKNNWSNRCKDNICSKNLADKAADVFIQLDDMRVNGGMNNKPSMWGLVCRLFSMKENRNKWVDIIINTNFSDKDDGYLNIWINDVKRCEYKGRITVTRDFSKFPGPNHRRGIYVSSTKKWDKYLSSKKKPTFIAYYDEFRVGKSREEVDIRIIEKNGGKPVD